MVIASGSTPEFIRLNTGEPPFAVLPAPAEIFGKRAARFRALAPGHDLAPYLEFLGELAEAQHVLANALVSPALDQDDLERSIAHGMPPLSKALAAESGVASILAALIADLQKRALEPGPQEALARLQAMAPDERAGLVTSVADGAFPLEYLAEAAIAAAALQVGFAMAAAQLDISKLKTVEEGLCPACGSAPVASLIVGWPQAPSARYLCCSLCNTNWNYVRVKCTACTSTQAISYRQIEGSSGDMAAEVCESCRGYAKHLIQQKTPSIDPFADDIASYGLDVLLREEGWKRISLNPFLVG